MRLNHSLWIGLTAFAASLATPNADAQIPSGDLVVLTSSLDATPTNTLFRLPAAGGAPVTILGATPSLLDAATSVEVEPRSGDLLLATVGSPGDNEIWRLSLSGLVVTAEPLLVTLPGTADFPVVDTHLELPPGPPYPVRTRLGRSSGWSIS